MNRQVTALQRRQTRHLQVNFFIVVDDVFLRVLLVIEQRLRSPAPPPQRRLVNLVDPYSQSGRQIQQDL